MTKVIALEGKIHQRASRRAAVTVAMLMGRKNAPRNFVACDAIGAQIVDTLKPPQRHALMRGKPDKKTQEHIRGIANGILDIEAAYQMIDIFAYIANIGEIAQEELDTLTFFILDKVKGDNRAEGRTVLWPKPDEIEAHALALLGSQRPVDLICLRETLLYGLNQMVIGLVADSDVGKH